MKEYSRQGSLKTFLGSLLVGGTALGAGMLALPVATAGSGILPAWLIYLLCWGFSVCTGFLFVEIGLQMPKNANIVSMATETLGIWGRRFAWVLYIFLFYLLTIAYIAGGGKLISVFLGPYFPGWLGTIIFTLFFGLFIYAGTKASGRINGLLMVGLIATYLVFITLGAEKVSTPEWITSSWLLAFVGLPIIFTSFSYQGIVPSLLTYFDRDLKKMRIAIIFGTLIPLLAYLVWDFVIKGIVPAEGEHGLLEARAKGLTAVDPLHYFLADRSVIYVAGKAFAFFALTTSFIGVTLGLRDFLADSLSVKKTPSNNLALCALIYIPAVCITLINPSIFLMALSLAGGFGCVLLLGALPIVMAWVSRARHKDQNRVILGGGNTVLFILFLFVVFEMVIQIWSWM